MDSELDYPAETQILGQRLRSLRLDLGLSLADVAAASGISRSFLSTVETGKSDLSIGRLMRLLNVYGVKLGDLLPEPASDALVVRHGEERRVASWHEGIHLSLLTRDTRRAMMPMIATFAAGASSEEHLRHEGDEFAHVLEGVIAIDLEHTGEVILKPGDSIYFDAAQSHAYRNAGSNAAKIFAVVTPPYL